MCAYEKQSLDVIGAKLNLLHRTLFYWKKEYDWDKKRFKVEHTKYQFNEELLDFSRKMTTAPKTGEFGKN